MEKICDFLGLEMKPGDIFLMAGELGLIPHLFAGAVNDRNESVEIASLYFADKVSGGRICLNSRSYYTENILKRAILVENPEWFINDPRFKDILGARYSFFDDRERFIRENFGLYIQGLILGD